MGSAGGEPADAPEASGEHGHEASAAPVARGEEPAPGETTGAPDARSLTLYFVAAAGALALFLGVVALLAYAAWS